MSSFQPTSLSDEDIAQLLDTCAAVLRFVRQDNQQMQLWRCPVCGLQVRVASACDVPARHVAATAREQAVLAC